MRMKGKKAIFNYKDTYCLDNVLNPVILGALKKFYEVKHSDKSHLFGIPYHNLIKHGHYALPEGSSIFDRTHAQDSEADAIWDEILLKMIYAFEGDLNVPDWDDYDFDYNTVVDGEDPEYGKLYRLESTNKDESSRYHDDMVQHNKRVKEGQELFGQFYDSLGW